MKNILLCSMHSPLEIFPKKCRFKLVESCFDHYMAKKNWNSNNVVLQSSTVLALLNNMQRNATTPNIVWPTMLEVLVPSVHCGKVTTHKTLETMRNARASPQQCWKSCANRSNIVAPRLGVHRTKEMLGVVSLEVWPVSNFAQQHATGCANRRNV